MITHSEAEVLISARQDAPLDPVVERELQAHLATCDDCRAFAVATERLTAGIKAMPSVPVNPRTRREVMEQVERGRNPLAGIFAGFGGGFQTGPVLAGVATLVIIGLFGWLALDRLVFEDDGDGDNQIAAVPTEQAVDQEVASPTQVPPTEESEPTETSVPEEPEETAEPTATTAPTEEPTEEATEEPTAEPEPTDEPEPTAEPEPTEEPEPTAEPEPTQEPEPTATTAPTEEPTEEATEETDDEPTDLTTLSEPADVEETAEPTATTEPTEEATEQPTEEVTEEATEEPTEEPTAEPEPTDTPGIEPIEGMEVQESDENGAAGSVDVPENAGSGPPAEDGGTIEPSGDDSATDDDASEDGETEEPSGEEVGTTAIEPMDDDGVGGIEPDSEPESTPDAEEAEQVPELMEGESLAEYSVPYTNIAGDPSGHLGLTPEGRLEFMQVPDGASRTTWEGFRIESGESQPSVVHLCGEDFCEPGMEAPDSDTWQGDVPLGVIGETTYFMRMHSDRTEIFGASSSGTSLVEPQLLTELEPTSAPSTVYENDGIMFAWLSTGEWLEISGGNAQLFSGNYPDPYNLRFAPLAGDGPLIGYFSNGTLIIAPVTAPDSPVFSLPTDGIDFDMTGWGDRVAIIQGNNIVIYDMDGNQLQVFSGGELQPGSLIWLNNGIVYVDRNTGALYEIPATAP